MQALLRPTSVAVVGASVGANRGHSALRNLLDHGFAGPLYPVNPGYTEILGLPCYPSLSAIGRPVDLAVIATPGSSVPGLLAEAGAHGAAAAIVPGAGFAETGDRGRALQDEVARVARAHGMALCGPNCLGVASAPVRAVAMASSPDSVAGLTLGGPIALVSQSGGLLMCAVELAVQRGVPFRYVVSSGNEAVTSSVDYLEHMLADPEVRVLALIAEGMPHGRRFLDLALRATRVGKRTVLLKLGTSPLGQVAAASHTASLAAEERVLEGVCRQAGVQRVWSVDELVETAALAGKLDEPTAAGVALVGVSGGTGVLVADWAERVGLEVPPLPAAAAEALVPLMPAYTSPSNPLDGTGGLLANASNFWSCLEILDRVPEFGTLVFTLPLKRDRGAEGNAGILDRLLTARDRVRTPIVVVSVVSEALGGVWRDAVSASPVPVVQDVRTGFQAIGAQFQWWRRRRALLSSATPPLAEPTGDGGSPALSGHLITEIRLGPWLERAGIAAAPGLLARNLAEAAGQARALGYPVALKVQSPDLPHKAAAGALALNLRDEEALRGAWDRLEDALATRRPSPSVEGILVQAMVEHSAELILGAHEDSAFGPVLVFGRGGTGVEAAGQVALRPLPLLPGDVDGLVEETLPTSALPPEMAAALRRAIAAFADAFCASRGRLRSLEVNPLAVVAGPPHLVALDALALGSSDLFSVDASPEPLTSAAR